MNRNFPKHNNGGAAMLISVIFFLFIALAITSGLVSPVVRELRNTNDGMASRKSQFLSESGLEDAYYRFKNSLPIGSELTLTLDDTTALTTITVTAPDERSIVAVGDTNSRQRTNRLVLSTGTGVTFSYGVQVGAGGLTMGNNSVVNGSVYSNGSITGIGTITGAAFSANSSGLSADQSNEAGSPDYDVTFGDTNGTQDFAQSFRLSVDGAINKVDLYIKKVSTPSNLTVRIVANSGGNPGTTTLASGTLSASLVSTNYGWVSVPMSTNPELNAGTTYWLVIDGVTNSARYYKIGAKSGTYPDGTGKIGRYASTWADTTPSGLDGFFRVYLGGVTGLIDGINIGSAGLGNAYAHTVNNSTVAGTNYCQAGSGNNKPCNTSQPDPSSVAMPISDQNILDWKDDALAGGTFTGDFTVDSTTASLGPRKIIGNLTVINNATLTLNGTLWVTGNVNISNNAAVRLSAAYGEAEGVIVADGTVNISNNATFSGSGTAGSYLMVLSTSTSTSAITLANNGGAVILYAANGTVNLANNASAKALNGKYINLNNNTNIIYDSGLVNSNFVSGPSGGWNIASWKEIE